VGSGVLPGPQAARAGGGGRLRSEKTTTWWLRTGSLTIKSAAAAQVMDLVLGGQSGSSQAFYPT
jgi:hypothetical protein